MKAGAAFGPPFSEAAIDIMIAWSIVTQPARCNGAPQPRAGLPRAWREFGRGDFFTLQEQLRSDVLAPRCHRPVVPTVREL